jgi:5'-nucleotidase
MKKIIPALTALLIIAGISLTANQNKKFTLVITSDLHSQLLGYAPNSEYTPGKTFDDPTKGGWSRIASVINTERSRNPGNTLVFDAGDFLMGSLFHVISREEALELSLLKKMGYDALTPGNHEFDLKPEGLARILNSAAEKDSLPLIVASNTVFSPESDKDDTLEQAFKNYVKEYAVLERNGTRIGIFGLMGENAAEVAPFAKPVTFSSRFKAAEKMVNILRNTEKADIVICLSHSGINSEKKKSEDQQLALKIKGIDIIISGHTHQVTEKPIIEGKTIIVQPGAYGSHAGVLDIVLSKKGVSVKDYRAINIDDSIKGDPEIDKIIDEHIKIIDSKFLKPKGLSFYQIVAETGFILDAGESETNLGNFIADAIRWSSGRYGSDPKDPDSKISFAVESNGMIRDPLVPGTTGKIAACDLFRTIPMGIGPDNEMGYPLIAFYLHASEIKKALEVVTTLVSMKNDDYYIQVSGIKYSYNPKRAPFDRVTSISTGDELSGYEELDYSSKNNKLYRVSGSIYNATFLKVIGGYTYDILTIIPKDRKGKPVDDLTSMLIDRDPAAPGIQELKVWEALFEYTAQLPDTNGNGIPDIPEIYAKKQNRMSIEPSINPVNLLSRGTAVTYAFFGALTLLSALTLTIAYFILKFIRRKI